tara:strand:- start:104 stop:442 length:339 start_codon:yes stop_codon:yes gene_type:complete
MNIKKSRIIQIIKEEMQKLSEDDGSDDGIAPVSLTRPPRPTAPSDELAYVEIQIRLAKDKLMELEAMRAQLAGEEPAPEGQGPIEPSGNDDTEIGNTDYMRSRLNKLDPNNA